VAIHVELDFTSKIFELRHDGCCYNRALMIQGIDKMQIGGRVVFENEKSAKDLLPHFGN
jgi:hypothetical protein